LLTAALFLGSLALVFLGLNRHGIFTTNRDLRYGAQVRECQLEAPGVESFHFRKGMWYFVVVGTLEENGSFLNYLETLLASPRIQTGNLKPLALIDGHDEAVNIQQYVKANNLSYAVMPLHDIRTAALTGLGITNHGKRFFFLDPDLRTVFHSEFMKPKDLRLLMEKYFGSPSTSIDVSPIRIGDSMPTLSVTPVSPHLGDFETRASLLVVFTANCVSCSLDNKLVELALHQDTLKGSASMEGLNLSLIFSPAFVARDISNRVAETGIDIPAFIATELVGIEDPYRQESYHRWDVLIIKVNETGEVTLLASFENFLNAVFDS
jgi:hypothetical protein